MDLYFVFFHISSADYRHASGQTKSLIEKYHKVAKASKEYMDEVADSDSSDDDITEKKEAYKKIFRDYQDRHFTKNRRRDSLRTLAKGARRLKIYSASVREHF